jgi:hypothetical protein
MALAVSCGATRARREVTHVSIQQEDDNRDLKCMDLWVLAEAWDEGRKIRGIESKTRTSKNRFT